MTEEQLMKKVRFWYWLRRWWHMPGFMISRSPEELQLWLLWTAIRGPSQGGRRIWFRRAKSNLKHVAISWVKYLFWLALYMQPFSCKSDRFCRRHRGFGVWNIYPASIWADYATGLCDQMELRGRDYDDLIEEIRKEENIGTLQV